jgi:hypothetical protein
MFHFYSSMNLFLTLLLCIPFANADYPVDSASFSQGKGYVEAIFTTEV